MRLPIFILFCLSLFFSGMTCQKKSAVICGTSPQVEPEEPLTDARTFRDDIPAPPIDEWRDINVAELDTCHRILWKYLKNMYPIKEDNFWGYEIYSLADEPEDVLENRTFRNSYGFFFRDTILRESGASPPEGMTCAPIDSTFFIDAVGMPTCKYLNKVQKFTTFFYNVKFRWRRGPVPYINEINPENGQRCNTEHFQFASFLRCQFDWETGELMYIDWH